MIKNTGSNKFIRHSLVLIIVLITGSFTAYSQVMPKMKMDTTVPKQVLAMQEEIPVKKDMQMKNGMDMDSMMLPMPFFTHMAMPMNVGSYNLRATFLPTEVAGKTTTEFNMQFTTGLSKTVGLFLGGSGPFDSPTLEAMFQFLVWKSRNGMNAISPIIEFEFPLAKESERKVYTLVGFSSTFSTPKLGFNQVLHYSPLEDLAEGSISVVGKISKRLFLVGEISGVIQKGEAPIYNLLAGIKFRLNKNFMIGIGYQHPLTTNKDFSSQYIIQPELNWKR